MSKVIAAGSKLYAICKDGKITKEELPEFLEAVADLVAGIVAIILPFIKGDAAKIAQRIAAGLALAARS